MGQLSDPWRPCAALLTSPLCRPQHVALCIKLIAAWFVPDVPQSVKNEVLKKKYQRLEEKRWRGGAGWEQGGAGVGPLNPFPASSCSPKSTDV